MPGGRCITVPVGTELHIGCDPSCDIVVSLPRQSSSRLLPVAALCRTIARVSCDAAGALSLTVTTHNIYAFVDGVRLTSVGRSCAIRNGATVAFGFYDCLRTYSFVSSGLCLAPLRAAGTADAPARRRALPSPLSAQALCEAQSPRSPRVVQIVAPPSPPPSGGSVGSGADGLPPSPSKRPRSALSSMRPPSGKGFATMSGKGCMETFGDRSTGGTLAQPYSISPFVVHVVGSRTAAQPLVVFRGPARGLAASFVSSLATTFEAAAFGSYVTDNGCRMIRQQMRLTACDAALRTAASTVIEELHEAFDADNGQFYGFSPDTRGRLLSLFWQLADHAELLLLHAPLTVYCESPILCCGDIHGSFADLKIIFEKAVPFGHWSLLSMPLLFLGDYVDRGPHDVEVMLYLIAWFVLCPDKIIMLRGNHEDEEVNGDMEHYGDGSFRFKCRAFFGEEDGDRFWERVNDIFVRLSVIAIVDERIFACHGGIPLLRRGFEDSFDEVRKTQTSTENSADRGNDEEDTPSEDLLRCLMEGTAVDMQRFFFRGLMPAAGDSATTARQRRLIRELLWNDPAASAQEGSIGGVDAAPESFGDKFNEFGFRTNLGRGDTDGIIYEFNASAVENFLKRWGFSLLIRAHQQKSSGAEMVQAGRVLTLFSCSNYTGDTNKAGACVVMDGMIHLISWQRPLTEEPIHSDSATQAWAPGRCPTKSNTGALFCASSDPIWTSTSDEPMRGTESKSREYSEIKTVEYG